ncbi:MAG: hydrogenase iron-sulfur subunit [Bacillota bacterium]
MDAGPEPKIVGFLCNWCSYAAADLAGINRLQYPASVRIIRVPCSGRVSPLFLLTALRRGADAVLVSGCHPGDCHYTSGNLVARRRFAMLKSLLEFAGLDEGRVNFTWISASEAADFARVTTRIYQRAKDLGPYRGALRKESGVPRRE